MSGNSEWGWSDISKKLTIFFVSLFLFVSFIYYFFPASFGKTDDTSPHSLITDSSTFPPYVEPEPTPHPLISLSSRNKQVKQTIGPERRNTNTKQAPTRYPSLIFPPDDGGEEFDFHLDVRPENDLVLLGLQVPETERLWRLEKWLTRNGGRFDGFEFKNIAPEYRGVFASRDLPSGYEFMFVPAICMIDQKHFNSSIIAKLIHHYKEDWTKYQHIHILYWYVLIERFNPNSFWKYWFAILPLNYKTVPAFWTEEERDWLKGTYALHYLLYELKTMREEYDLYTNLIPALKVFTFEQYKWSVVAIHSRIWGSQGGETALPLMDMINHGQPIIHLSHDWMDYGTSYTLTENLTKGDQIYFHYGSRSQRDWLLHYGFTAPQNEDYNTVYISMAIPSDDPQINEKTTALGGWNTFECELSLNYDMSPEAKHGTRWCYALARTAVYQGKNVSGVVSEQMGPTSIVDELHALAFMAEECKKALKKCPTTLKEDLYILKDKNLIATNFNYYNALTVRSQEKQILEHVINLYDLYNQLIEMLEIDVNASTDDKKSLHKDDTTIVEIIDSFVKDYIEKLNDKYIENYFSQVLPILFPQSKE